MRIIIFTLLLTLSFTTSYGQSFAGIYTSQSDFNDSLSLNCIDMNLTFEDFFRQSMSTTSCGPVVSSVGDNCFDPGELPDGFTISVSGGSNVSWIPTETFSNSVPYIGAGAFVPFTIITFDPPVSAVAMEYIATQDGDSKIRLFGEGGTEINSYDFFSEGYEEVFLGVIADEPITKMELEAPNDGGELIGQFSFGAQCSSSLSIQNISDLTNFRVYPNPVGNEKFIIDLEFSLAKDLEIQLINVFGQEVYKAKHLKVSELKTEVNAATLPTGVYFIKVMDLEVNQMIIHQLIRQ